MESRSGVTLDSSLFNLHLTLLALYFVSTVPAIPLLLDWINLKMPVLCFGNQDTYRIPAIFTAIASAVIWHHFSATDIKELALDRIDYRLIFFFQERAKPFVGITENNCNFVIDLLSNQLLEYLSNGFDFDDYSQRLSVRRMPEESQSKV